MRHALTNPSVSCVTLLTQAQLTIRVDDRDDVHVALLSIQTFAGIAQMSEWNLMATHSFFAIAIIILHSCATPSIAPYACLVSSL